MDNNFNDSTVSARVTPERNLNILSKDEVNRLADPGDKRLHDLFRRCALAVMNSGSQIDDAEVVLEQFKNFDIRVIQQERGIKLEIDNAPAQAFVDGQMLKGIKENLFSALRDIVYVNNEINNSDKFDLEEPASITNAIFHILRNARLLRSEVLPNIVCCWGGHSINDTEYKYTKKVGYELGLRDLDICTGCGPGAMKGPMKGATIAHAKQRNKHGRYIGVTEPGIIAVESPNPIVNDLVILPDIEKRLEAFVRLSHGIIVFPGGVGTAEEILYLLGILLNPKNKGLPFPLVFTGPASAASYFEQIDRFIHNTIGQEACDHYQIIIDDPAAVARVMRGGMDTVRDYRRDTKDAFYFNWVLHIDETLQRPFKPTHENMASLELNKQLPPHLLAANLRRAFSGIVSGNVKEEGVKAIKKHGPFEIKGEKSIAKELDTLLTAFVEQKRMKIPTKEYVPCYKVIQ